MQILVITPRVNGEVTIVDLSGSIRLGEGSTELHRQIEVLAENGARKVLLNMNRVAYIDSSGLGELVSSFKTLQNFGGHLMLFGISNRVNELMTMTKLLTVFDVFETEEAAINGFSLHESESTKAVGATSI